MIRKLKRRFTILATASMFLLMTVLILVLNLINFSTVISESDETLDLLSKSSNLSFSGSTQLTEKENPFNDFMPKGMSPEVPYEARYFTVLIEDDEVITPDLSKIISVDNDAAKEYVIKAIAKGKDRGFIGTFRYLKTTDNDSTKIIFLDCGRKFETYNTFFKISVVVGLAGCLFVFFAFLFFSERIVRPIAESYEKQKRFISDAGHEIKTPLTIINANVDLLEADEEKEELAEIRQQTARLTDLTNSLVYLSKMEESGNTIQKIETPISEISSEMTNSFKALATSNGINFTEEIEPNIVIKAAPDAIKQLISIILENAMKYTPKDGDVNFKLSTNKKSAIIAISNTSINEIKQDDLKHIFDRFYRTDSSRNSETGGHGIGLSIAKTVVESHNGTIVATTKTGNDFCITVTLPQ